MKLNDYINKNHKQAIKKPFSGYVKKSLTHDKSSKDLIEFCKILKECGVNYRILFGTLLGLYRDGKLIDHDLDMDIATTYSDHPKLYDAIIEAEKRGFKIVRYSFDILVTIFRDDVYIDIYLFKERGKNLKCSVYNLDKSCFIDKSVVKCNDTDLDTIPDPEKFFKEYYGGDWNKPIKGIHAHPKHKSRK